MPLDERASQSKQRFTCSRRASSWTTFELPGHARRWTTLLQLTLCAAFMGPVAVSVLPAWLQLAIALYYLGRTVSRSWRNPAAGLPCCLASSPVGLVHGGATSSSCSSGGRGLHQCFIIMQKGASRPVRRIDVSYVFRFRVRARRVDGGGARRRRGPGEDRQIQARAGGHDARQSQHRDRRRSSGAARRRRGDGAADHRAPREERRLQEGRGADEHQGHRREELPEAEADGHGRGRKGRAAG